MSSTWRWKKKGENSYGKIFHILNLIIEVTRLEAGNKIEVTRLEAWSIRKKKM